MEDFFFVVEDDGRRDVVIRVDAYFDELMIAPLQIDRQAVRRAQTVDGTVSPGGIRRKSRQQIDIAVFIGLQKHLRDAGAGAIIPIDLERRMRVEKIRIGAAAGEPDFAAGRDEAQLAAQQTKRVVAIPQTGPHVDFPAEAPARAVITADFQAAAAGVGELRRRGRCDLMRRMQPVQMGHVTVMRILLFKFAFPFEELAFAADPLGLQLRQDFTNAG